MHLLVESDAVVFTPVLELGVSIAVGHVAAELRLVLLPIAQLNGALSHPAVLSLYVCEEVRMCECV